MTQVDRLIGLLISYSWGVGDVRHEHHALTLYYE